MRFCRRQIRESARLKQTKFPMGEEGRPTKIIRASTESSYLTKEVFIFVDLSCVHESA